MKELSIKEKAERYDKLLVKLYEAKVDNNVCDERYCCVIDDIVPELKESEDEKIRKDLLGYLHTLPNHFSHNGSLVTEWVAWLEKREHSVSPLFTFEDVLTIQCAMAYAKFQDRELDVALKKLHDKVYDAYHDSKNHHIESQDGLKGEQIPANSAKTCKDEQKPYGKREECYDCQMNYGGTCKGSCAMKRGEQKPADKVEPKDYRSVDPHFFKTTDKVKPNFKEGDKVYSLRNGLECTIESIDETTYYGDTTNFDIKDQDNWKLVEQKPWSEEDKKLIDDTCHLINTLASGYGEKVTEPITFSGTQMIASIKDRLRALVENRPQSTWKPSDDQIGALEHFVRSIAESGFASPYDSNTKLVYSLLNDLKKLKL